MVAFRIGSEPVFTYSIYLLVGFLLAILWLAIEARRRGWRELWALQILVWALLPGILMGRLAYVLATLAGEAFRPVMLLHPWGEGFFLPGALWGGACGLLLLSFLQRRCWSEFLGAAVPALALAQSLGWVGAAVHGAAAGVSLPAGLALPSLRDLYGQTLPRFPLQYLAALLNLATWLLLAYARLSDRQRIVLYALITGAGLALLDVWRAGRQPLILSFSLEQMGWLVLALAGLVLALADLMWPSDRKAQVAKNRA